MNATDPAAKPDPIFSSIYQEYFPMVFRFGFRLLGDPELAMDLSQEVFLKLYAALNGGPAILEIKSWLFRTSANLSYDWLRRRRRHATLLHSAFPVNPVPRDVEGEFISSEDGRAVRESMDRLAPRDRLLLTLYAEGLPYRGIAESMGLREASVGKLLARAIQRLTREFKEGGRR
jgi:RNA polymerase sigma-70 factor (ECF subfamily)